MALENTGASNSVFVKAFRRFLGALGPDHDAFRGVCAVYTRHTRPVPRHVGAGCLAVETGTLLRDAWQWGRFYGRPYSYGLYSYGSGVVSTARGLFSGFGRVGFSIACQV